MATLIKLPSGLVVNLDNVTHINASTYEIRFVGEAWIDLNVKDLDTLRAWLDWQARDIKVEVEGHNSMMASIKTSPY